MLEAAHAVVINLMRKMKNESESVLFSLSNDIESESVLFSLSNDMESESVLFSLSSDMESESVLFSLSSDMENERENKILWELGLYSLIINFINM